MRINEETYKKFINSSITYKKSKYKNKKVIYDGIKFDSKKEGLHYLKLKSMQDLGIIKNLELQKEYILQPSFKLNGKTYRKISYYADFCYITTKDNKLHVVDVKGLKTDVYKLKKKMMGYVHNIEVEEV